ncbi:MAG: hypothetical protein QOD03_1167 [Verrucomicrobiota bacterium]|jgi:tetratricopeptide (TPR) repeat protein
MLTTKKRLKKSLIFFLTLATLITGCTPPGPRALLEGKKLLDRGNFDAAIEQLQTATTLLSTNAQAWNYLGLAYHQAGQATNAVQAYQRAVALDHDLFEAHYNLGSLWLEQGRLDAAKAELTAYTLRRGNSAEGWIKLATAQLRSRDLTGAEKNFNEALRLSPQNPEALNGLGLVQLQRNHPREAAQAFTSALTQQTNYAPALLNLAVVSHQYLNNRSLALQKYREYLALMPHQANWQAVSTAARALEQELNPAPVAVPRTVASAPVVHSTPSNSVIKSSSYAIARTSPPPPKAEPPAIAAKPQPVVAPPLTNLQAVKLQPEPIIKPAQEVSTVSAPIVKTSALASATSPSATNLQTKTEKRGFFTKINPLNLLHSSSKSSTNTSPSPSKTTGSATQSEGSAAQFARYSYQSPAKPADGDRPAAERVFSQAVQAQQANHLTEAIQGYRQAAQLDPGYYEAHYNLALALMKAGSIPSALATFETALALQPDRLDARLYFAQTLKQANYPIDAANELEKILATYPNDARAHLLLGNLYAQQLRQRDKAREHYQRVLELDPRNEQAPAVRDWLWANRL